MRLIDADALIADLELLAKYEDDFRQSVILGVVHTVRNRPTVDAVEVKHGRWEDVALSFVTVKEKCSICGKIVWEHGLNYCPNCGAKMNGGADHD